MSKVALALFIASLICYRRGEDTNGTRLLWLATAMLLGEYVHLFRDWGLL